MSVDAHAEALARACEIVAYKDAQPLRRALFRFKAERTPAIRAALAIWNSTRSIGAATAFVATYGLASFASARPPRASSGATMWTVARYANESRQLAALAALVPEMEVAPVHLGVAAGVLERPATLPRAHLALLERHVRGGDFLVAARVASTIGYFARMLPALERSRARAVLVSSDANPYAVALTCAARALGRRTAFVTHGHVAEVPPGLALDLVVVDGPIVESVYRDAGTQAHFVHRGAEGVSRPMRRLARDRVDTLGIFTSILVDWSRAARAIAALRVVFAPRRILLRLHPNREMRDPAWRRHVPRNGVVEISEGDRPVEHDAAACDLIACGSSSVHLGVMKHGVPSLYVPGLDELDDDYYRFVSAAITPRFDPCATTLDTVATFFDDPAWAARFARFDASYPDRSASCARDVATSLRAIVSAT